MNFIKNKQGFGKNISVLLTVIVLFLVIAGMGYAYWLSNGNNKNTESQDKEQIIGGDTDEGGCLIAAGYSWCEVKNKCLRIWEEPCISPDTQVLVEAYIKENISDLSPEKEVLGGKFYVTEIRFTEDGKAVVNYEDGHIALVANLAYAVQDGQVKILEFSVVKDDGSGSLNPDNNGSDQMAIDELTIIFSEKYNKEPSEITIKINDNRGDYLRGSVKTSLDPEASGGNFLAKRVNGKLELVMDGNGEIDCELVSDFPTDMVSDCAKK